MINKTNVIIALLTLLGLTIIMFSVCLYRGIDENKKNVKSMFYLNSSLGTALFYLASSLSLIAFYIYTYINKTTSSKILMGLYYLMFINYLIKTSLNIYLGNRTNQENNTPKKINNDYIAALLDSIVCVFFIGILVYLNRNPVLLEKAVTFVNESFVVSR